jgi:hypothetical protein
MFNSPQTSLTSSIQETSNITIVSLPSSQSTVNTVNTFVSTFRLASLSSTKSNKTSPIWEYFSHFDEAFHPDMKHHRICLVCRDASVDKAVSVGKDSSTAALISHLKTHKLQYALYIEAKSKAQAGTSLTSSKTQATMSSFLSDKKTLSTKFKSSFARWVVEDCMPLTICKSESFKAMIEACNSHVVVPSYQTLFSFLQSVKSASHANMKKILKGKYFSVTLDHWTSLAMENYGAITIHTIDNFHLYSFVLSCMKHPNGCTAVEMESQLLSDLEYWGLDKKSYFVACITDSASNMNSFGL